MSRKTKQIASSISNDSSLFAPAKKGYGPTVRAQAADLGYIKEGVEEQKGDEPGEHAMQAERSGGGARTTRRRSPPVGLVPSKSLLTATDAPTPLTLPNDRTILARFECQSGCRCSGPARAVTQGPRQRVYLPHLHCEEPGLPSVAGKYGLAELPKDSRSGPRFTPFG